MLLPPSFAAADGAFSASGGQDDDEGDIADPFALVDGDIPAEVAAQFAEAASAGDGGGGDSPSSSPSSSSTTTTIDDEQFEGGSGKVRAFSRVGEKDPYR